MTPFEPRVAADLVVLGVDLGTTFTAAASFRGGVVEPVTLGANGWSIPSVVHLSATGEVVCGEAAAYLGPSAPERTFQEFKRDFGSPIPLVTPDGQRSPEWMTTRLIEHVLRTAEDRLGRSPDALVITHPATWGEHRLELLRQCAADAGIPRSDFVAEPIAAAIHYSSLGRVAPGEIVAIYDFGGGTFDASVVVHQGSGIDIIGEPRGTERIGGIDLDQVILDLVNAAVDGRVADADIDDPSILADLYALRAECSRCKIALSSDLRSPIRVRIGTFSTEVLIQRFEFEERIEPMVQTTVDVLHDALNSAEVTTDELSRVLLVGGSARIPLVGQMVSNAMRIPISVDIDAASAIAQGAASHGGDGGVGFRGDVAHHDEVAPTPAVVHERFVAPGESLGAEQVVNGVLVRVDDGRSERAIPGDELTVGRSSGCSLTFADDRVSRVHGTLAEADGTWVYTDSSSNGSFVDGVAVESVSITRPVDVQLGQHGPRLTIVPDGVRTPPSLGIEVAGELVYPVAGQTYVIGRRPPADIIVDDPERFVSTSHLDVRSDGDGWSVGDLSTNGTFFADGRRLDRSRHRLSGDVTLALGSPEGPTVAFRFSAVNDSVTLVASADAAKRG
ncbi:MAG: Hsp70 family protein [Actinomycetota bacterium]